MSEPPHMTLAYIEHALLLLLAGLLLVGLVEVVRPFLTAILFGAVLAVAAWPARQALLRTGMPRGLAAALLLFAALALIVLPTVLLAPGLINQALRGGRHLLALLAARPLTPPHWLAALPLVGDAAVRLWDSAASGELNIAAALAPYSEQLRRSLLGLATGLLDSLLQLLLALGVATFFWVSGAELAAELRSVLERLGGRAAAGAVDTIGASIRGVAYGVVGTALLQAVLMGIGLALAGIKGAVLLGCATLVLALSQIGLPLVYAIDLGSAWWCFHNDRFGWAVFLLVWCAPLSALDNVVRPWLISFGVPMPLSLVILGVFGGFISFGFLGLFIGPSLLAVAYTLLQAWRGRKAAAGTVENREQAGG
jgi:predicted PurR-regulated permease PerM